MTKRKYYPVVEPKHDVREGITAVVAILNSQVDLIRQKALVKGIPLTIEEARLLMAYGKSLVQVSMEERAQAQDTAGEIMDLSDEEIAELEVEADQSLRFASGMKKKLS